MWNYIQPTEIIFKHAALEEIDNLIQYTRGLLVIDEYFEKNGLAAKILKKSKKLVGFYSDIQPNPTLDNADNCAAAIISNKVDFVLAIGGGSVLDCAKISAALAKFSLKAAEVHSGEKKLTGIIGSSLPVIALPTTAGTGSEVTAVSVLTDESQKKKAPILDFCLFPKLAIIDPELTVSMPPDVTAATGMDALAHALEGFWSKNHQPICESLSLEAARKIFAALPAAFKNGTDIKARAEMCEASVMSGLAFALPKTAGSHACSYPLTGKYNLPHGEACALTLAAFTRINASAESGRVDNFAKKLGFTGAHDMADHIDLLKKEMGLAMTLKDAKIPQNEIPTLAQLSQHPNMLNNPVDMTTDKLIEMYTAL